MSEARAKPSRLNPLAMLQKSSRLTVGTQLGAVLNFAVSLVIARTLGPEKLGAVSLVSLTLLYATFLRLGIFDGGERELIDRLGKGRTDEARHIQRVAFTGDLLWSLLPVIGLLAMSAAFGDPIRRIGFMLAPLMYLGTVLYRMLMRLNLAHQRVNLVASVNAIRAIGQPLLLLGLLPVIGPFSLLVAPLIVDWLLSGVYILRPPPLGLRLTFDRAELRHLIRIGFPLGLMGFVYWTYRLVGVTSVATFLPVRDLGLYNFVGGPVSLILMAFAEFSAVLTPTLWAEISHVGDAKRLSRECVRVTLFITLVGCLLANFAQAGFRPFVLLIAPTFAESTPIFDILAFNIVLLTITFVPGLVIDSAVINRQWQHLVVWFVGLLINVAVNILAVRLGGGMLTIAANDIWVQLLVSIAVFGLAQRFIFTRPQEAWRLYAILVGMLALCAASFAVTRMIQIDAGMTWGWLVAATALRVGSVLAIWVGPCIWIVRSTTGAATDTVS